MNPVLQTEHAAGSYADPIRVLFLVPRLSTGGSERQLVQLARAFDKRRLEVTIAALYDGGEWWADVERIPGIRLRSLHKGGRYDVLGFAARLTRLVRAARPHVVQTHGASAVFGLMAAAIGRSGLIVGIRNSNMELAACGWLEPLLFRLGAHLSRAADLLIANSDAGRRHYTAQGYPADRMRVVHNGFDTSLFSPARERGRVMRQEWGIAPNDRLIGIVARIDRSKDHDSFLAAAAAVARQEPCAKFVVIGDGSAEDLARLKRVAQDSGISGRVVWAGRCDDVVAAYNALDLCVSTSTSEGISNSIGEAMSCGIPCAVTDAGDSAWLVNDASRVSPLRRPDLAAAVWLRIIRLDEQTRTALGDADRRRILGHFSLRDSADRFQSWIEAVARGR